MLRSWYSDAAEVLILDIFSCVTSCLRTMNTKYRGCQAQRDEVEGEEIDWTEDEILSVNAQQRLNLPVE